MTETGEQYDTGQDSEDEGCVWKMTEDLQGEFDEQAIETSFEKFAKFRNGTKDDNSYAKCLRHGHFAHGKWSTEVSQEVGLAHGCCCHPCFIAGF